MANSAQFIGAQSLQCKVLQVNVQQCAVLIVHSAKCTEWTLWCQFSIAMLTDNSLAVFYCKKSINVNSFVVLPSNTGNYSDPTPISSLKHQKFSPMFFFPSLQRNNLPRFKELRDSLLLLHNFLLCPRCCFPKGCENADKLKKAFTVRRVALHILPTALRPWTDSTFGTI